MNFPQAISAASSTALELGTLKPTDTKVVLETVGEVDVVIRIFTHQKAKQKATKEQKKKAVNPFLPHEESMFVGSMGLQHKILLNKFPIQSGHILLCTTDYQPQTDPLNVADLAATYRTLELLKAPHLAFYNFGVHSGRSQPHKHVQILPLPLCGGVSGDAAVEAGSTPIDGLVASAAKGKEIGHIFTLPEYNFAHAVALLPAVTLPIVGSTWRSDVHGVDAAGGIEANGAKEAEVEATKRADAAGALLLSTFKDMLAAAGLRYGSSADSELSYNWLCTSKWMMIVGRGAEGFEGFNINSVGFAGSILVFNDEALARVKELGPMQLLAKVASPTAAAAAAPATEK